MNKIAHILAAALGAALAVAFAATLSPAPSAAWAFWALLGGVAGYLAQDPRGVAVETLRVTSEMAKIVSRRFRHLCRRVWASFPFWTKAALTVFRPRVELLLLVIFAVALPVACWSSYSANLSVLVAGIVSGVSFGILLLIFSVAIDDVSLTLLAFRHAPWPSEKVTKWGKAFSPTKTRWNYATEAEYRRAERKAYRHSRRTISRMSFGEIAFAVLSCWISFLLGALRITVWIVALVAALLVLNKYPDTVLGLILFVATALFWRLMLRGAGQFILAAARRLHSQKRLVAGAGATLGTVSGLAASLVWGILGVPILAATVGAALGAMFGWVLLAGSSKVVARFGVAAA